MLDGAKLIESATNALAVDPGLSGAIWRIGSGSFFGRRDFKALPEIALALRDLCSFGPLDVCVIEDVHAMPKQGVCSMFSFGKAAGYAEAALSLCAPAGCPILTVAPQRWQNWVRKEFGWPLQYQFDSRQICLNHFPKYTEYFARKMDHNSADAVLMACWGLQQIKNPGS